jgi:hypothetical protein
MWMRKEEKKVPISSQERRYIVVPHQNGKPSTQERERKERERKAAIERDKMKSGKNNPFPSIPLRPSPPARSLFQQPETRVHPHPTPQTSTEEFRLKAKSFMNPEQRREYDAMNDALWEFNRTKSLREAFGTPSERQDSDAGFIRERKREMNRQRQRDHAMAEAWTDLVFQSVLGLGSALPFGLLGKGMGAATTRLAAARGAGPLGQRAAGLAGTVVPTYAAQKVAQKTGDAINRTVMGKEKWEASQQQVAQGRAAIQKRNPGLEYVMGVVTNLPAGTPVNPFVRGQFLSRSGDMLVEGALAV